MVYFLSDVERKMLLRSLLPLARESGVSEDVRGWNWHQGGLKPYYRDVLIPMYSVVSSYCPTHRDVYVNRVEGVQGRVTEPLALGVAVHRAVSTVITSFLEGRKLDFERWYEDALRERNVRRRFEGVKRKTRLVWDYVYLQCESRLAERISLQPYSSRRDSLATAIPFLVEHKLTGELLGLSGLLSIDCYDYLHGIVFDLKVSDEERVEYRLAPTGYAMVLESVYEVPVDIGCVVYVKFRGGKLHVSRDLFFISTELRSWWMEERDQRLEMVAQRRDPGLPRICPKDCIYLHHCRGIEPGVEGDLYVSEAGG